jgi:hypothetical protein
MKVNLRSLPSSPNEMPSEMGSKRPTRDDGDGSLDVGHGGFGVAPDHGSNQRRLAYAGRANDGDNNGWRALVGRRGPEHGGLGCCPLGITAEGAVDGRDMQLGLVLVCLPPRIACCFGARLRSEGLHSGRRKILFEICVPGNAPWGSCPSSPSPSSPSWHGGPGSAVGQSRSCQAGSEGYGRATSRLIWRMFPHRCHATSLLDSAAVFMRASESYEAAFKVSLRSQK